MKKLEIEVLFQKITRLFRFIPDNEDIIDVLCEAMCRNGDIWGGATLEYKDLGREEKMRMRGYVIHQLHTIQDLANGCETLTEVIRETVLAN